VTQGGAVIDEQFDAVHYAGMALLKVGIILFNLAPYVALRMIEWNRRP
jgi:hypothetical protein